MSEQPNILLILADQHRFDFLPAAMIRRASPAPPVRAPNLQRLALRGAQFTRVFTPAPLCAPARACLASGRAYHRCGVVNNRQDYPLNQPTFYGLLREAGYHVAGVGKFDLQKATANHALDGRALLQEWGFSDGIDSKGKWDAVNSWDGHPHDAYMAYLACHGLAEMHVADMSRRRDAHYACTEPTPLPDHAYGDTWVAGNGLRLLESFASDQPWFLQVNFPGPHDPMDVTESMHDRWEGVDFPPPVDCWAFDAATHTRIRRNYAAMIENIDGHFGRYLEVLAGRGELDDTLIVYTSDHGEMLGDHNRWAKSSYYQPSVGVPLIVAGPRVRAGQMLSMPVSLLDLAATFLESAGLPIPSDMDSRSLYPLLAGQAADLRPYVVSGLIERAFTWHLIFDGRHKLVLCDDDAPLLFDLAQDPEERFDIARAQPEIASRLRALLERELQTT